MTKALTALAKKKTLFALVLALTIFGAVYGFAATLNVGTNRSAPVTRRVASCQADRHPDRHLLGRLRLDASAATRSRASRSRASTRPAPASRSR